MADGALRVLLGLGVVGCAIASIGQPARSQSGPPPLLYRDATVGEPASGPTPLIVALHPWGSSARAFMRSVGVGSVACRARWVFADGPLRDGAGYSWLSVAARDRDQRTLAENLRSRARDVAGLIASLRSESREEREPVIVAGHSQGAMVALAVGTLYPQSVDGVVAAAGTLPRSMWPARVAARLPAFVAVHGHGDRFVPFRQTAALMDVLRLHGASAALRALPAGHRFAGVLARAFRTEIRRMLIGMNACQSASG